ncbi:hypothetical protein YPPY102_1878, partial [Yersinia pestis PY-102]
MAAFLQLKLF